MKGSGGTEGGVLEFIIGICMALGAVYLFFDSVHMESMGAGMISGAMGRGRGGHGLMETTSMGIIFIPFGIGVFSLFVDASKKWAWWVTWIGLAIIIVEMLSKIRFRMDMKTSHFVIMMILFLLGCATMFRSYRDGARLNQKAEASSDSDATS